MKHVVSWWWRNGVCGIVVSIDGSLLATKPADTGSMRSVWCWWWRHGCYCEVTLRRFSSCIYRSCLLCWVALIAQLWQHRTVYVIWCCNNTTPRDWFSYRYIDGFNQPAHRQYRLNKLLYAAPPVIRLSETINRTFYITLLHVLHLVSWSHVVLPRGNVFLIVEHSETLLFTINFYN